MNDPLDKASKYAEKKLGLGRRGIPRAKADGPEGEGRCPHLDTGYTHNGTGKRTT